jgi:hypothetical protein
MLRSLRKPLAITIATLASVLFVAAGSVWAANCGDTNFDGVQDTTCACGDVVVGATGFTYVLPGDLNCYGATFSNHGLLIGNAGIGIDGAGNTIYGADPAVNDGFPGDTRDCKVALETDPGVLYECVEHGCRTEIDSGVFNALSAYDSNAGCDARAGVSNGQGGCDDVTVKNLVIQGFCDGIFMSGTCFVGGDLLGQLPIKGILIEGNTITNNGKDCAATFTTGGSVGYWGTTPGDSAYFHDGIFVAMAGEETEADGWTGCTDYGDDRLAVTIRKNDVLNQKGCGKESCPGGNAINIEGGVEDDYYGVEEFFYVGCMKVTRNLVKNAAFAGIQASHAASQSLIDGNIVKGNNYGGITYPCDFGQILTVSNNYLDNNKGPGIAALSPLSIRNNTVYWQKWVDFSLYPALSGIAFPFANDGILVGGEGSGSELSCNIVGGRQPGAGPPGIAGAGDITVESGVTATGDRNKCKDTANYADTGLAAPNGCRYATNLIVSDDGMMESPYLQADMNGDNVVNSLDKAIYTIELDDVVP